jgi:hypothetical protein
MVYGSALIQPAEPHLVLDVEVRVAVDGGGKSVVHDVALQVAFERRTLKPVFHLIGYRLWV